MMAASLNGDPAVLSNKSLRALADALILNVSLAIGVLIGYTITLAGGDPAHYPGVFQDEAVGLLLAAVAMTTIALMVFSASGLYSKTRAYRGRYKMLAVIQAVAVVFLVFGSLAAFIGDAVPFPSPLSLLMAGVMCSLGMAGARMWAYVWGHSQTDEVPTPTPPGEFILVVGGAGYIGSALIPQLLAAGRKVRLLDGFIYGEEAIASFKDEGNLEIVRADFRRVDQMVRAMRGVDCVIHLGAIVGDPACEIDSELSIEINLEATRMIAEVAKAHGIRRFVFASTCSVYGASDELLDERSSLKPVSLYARTKIASERVLIDLGDAQFRPTILRFGTVYGFSGRTRFDLVVNLLAAKAVTDGRITVFGEDQWRPFVHVADAAKAVALVATAPLELVGDETFNVGSDNQNLTLGDVGRIVAQLVPSAELIVGGVDGDVRNYRVRFDKIGETLRFTPDWSVEEGVRQVIDAFAEGSVRDYTLAEYSNVKFLSDPASAVLRTERAWLSSLVDISDPVIHLPGEAPTAAGR